MNLFHSPAFMSFILSFYEYAHFYDSFIVQPLIIVSHQEPMLERKGGCQKEWGSVTGYERAGDHLAVNTIRQEFIITINLTCDTKQKTNFLIHYLELTFFLVNMEESKLFIDNPTRQKKKKIPLEFLHCKKTPLSKCSLSSKIKTHSRISNPKAISPRHLVKQGTKTCNNSTAILQLSLSELLKKV